MVRLFAPSAAVALAVVLAPSASADPSDFQYVRTETGAVRCVISAPHVGCERSSADGFPGAPKSQSGPGNWNIASLDAGGEFTWGEGNIGGVDADEVTLTYGKTFHIKGWTVASSFDGTRFTNDASGHGMVVSINGVSPLPVATGAASQALCGPDRATALAGALAQLPPEPATGQGWSNSPIGGDYNPCADLSTILVMVDHGTASSPVQALMFHRGTYVGTGTSKAYGFTSLDAGRSTGDTVVLDYVIPGECDACAPASVSSVRYQWQGDHVAMLDPAPPS